MALMSHKDLLMELMFRSLFILNKINKIVYIDNHGLYRDDGLIIMPGNRKANNKIRKMLFKFFHGLKFEITVEMNKKIMQYLDVEFNLTDSTASPYMKPNTIVKYTNFKSNPPPSNIKPIL